MSSRSTLSSLLNIRSGEGLPIVLLTLFSFLVGAGGAFFYTAATTLFLESYPTTMLPLAYIGSGIAGWFLWFVSSRFSKGSAQSKQMLSSLIFLITSVVLFAIASQTFDMKIVSFALFVWIRIVTYISVVVFWNLAGSMFDLRQGKRLFGLIGAGEVISDMIGFFSIPLLLRFMKTADLLIIAAISLVLCLGLYIVIRTRFSLDKTSAEVNLQATPAVKVNIKRFFADRYAALLFLLAFLPMIGMYFMDYIFFDQAKILYSQPSVLASFVGIFFGFVAVAEFLVKTVLSGRLLNRYGIRVGLILLPIILALAVGLAALTGTFIGIGSIFFAFVAFGKLMDRVLRSGINDPAFQILYQPLPANERLNFQSMVEGVPKAAGNLIGGGVLLIFTLINFHNLVAYNYIFFIIIAVWIRLAWQMYVSYRLVLRNSITDSTTNNPQGEKAPPVIERLTPLLLSHDAGKVNRALIMLSRYEPSALPSAFTVALSNSSRDVLKAVLEMIRRFHSFAASKPLKAFLLNEQNVDISKQAEETLEYLNSMSVMSIDEAMNLVQSTDVSNRILAAKVLGESTRFQAIRLILQLIDDPSPRVKRAALVAAGKVRRQELWARLIEHLSIKEYSHTAASAITLAGGHIAHNLEQLFSRIGQDRKLQQTIIRIYRRMGERHIHTILRNTLRHPDKEVRYEVLEALADIGYRATSTEQSILRRDLEDEIAAVLWTVAARHDLESSIECADIVESLRHEVIVKNHRIFTILSVMYDAQIIRGLRDKLRSGSNEERVYALEILDITVDEQIKDDIVPLLEEHSAQELLETYRWRYPQEKLTVQSRLQDIVWKDHATVSIWTKACALEVLSQNPSEQTADIFAAFADHNEHILSQISVLALYRYSSERFSRFMENTTPAHKERAQKNITSCIINHQLTGLQKARYIQHTSYFRDVPPAIVGSASDYINEKHLNKGERFYPYENGISKCAVIVSGSITETIRGTTLQSGSIIYHILPENELSVHYTTNTDTHLLVIDREILDEIVWEHLPLQQIIDN